MTPAMPGRKCYRLVVMSFGLLCILQAALNISLRLLLYNKTVNMEASLKTVTEERDQLKRKLSDTDNKTVNIEASLKAVTEERDQLKRKLSDTDHYSHQGWIYFQSSFYYISTIRKTWHESRDDCLQRGADLMIINSREEQLFTMRLKDEMWIGLKDSKTVEKWKWVDGTPLTNRFTHYSLIHIHITKGFKELVLWPCLTHI
uniref:C-type lectin domain family 4 member F-like n=1 Tax=Monopterus albus TaxID=43700 RepID=UPI0009B4386B|nr:C-type lectin domain family 4 member F-like [Monopterus albus]